MSSHFFDAVSLRLKSTGGNQHVVGKIRIIAESSSMKKLCVKEKFASISVSTPLQIINSRTYPFGPGNTMHYTAYYVPEGILKNRVVTLKFNGPMINTGTGFVGIRVIANNDGKYAVDLLNENILQSGITYFSFAGTQSTESDTYQIQLTEEIDQSVNELGQRAILSVDVVNSYVVSATIS